MGNDVIDFVIPWVDGNDPLWIEQKNKYLNKYAEGEDSREIRYRDWGTLKYWFRGVEKYTPWVNKIHFITWGHLPAWLNLKHPKLNIVRHEDYIPEEYLPSFNSHVIELNLHRIKGLSTQFVYFNDDIFILQSIEPEDFFRNGLPCDICVANAITPRDGEFSSILLQDTKYINKNFDKRLDMTNNLSKWFSLKYGILLMRTILLLPWRYYTGFYNPHLAIAYKKDTFNEVWHKEPGILSQTCMHRFRNDNDVNQYIFRYWRLAKGEFIPHRQLGKYKNITDNNDEINKLIKKRSCKLLCINDKDVDCDFEVEKLKLIKSFEKIYTEKSAFER